ncbi:MAG TPA: hypothetical protein DCG33_02385 [Prevotellaceae bacterium]|nr:hypothetical protein [Prevotellaceae bacterium]
MHNSKKCSNFATESSKVNQIKDKTMARPIAETPILFGEDARRFEERMKHPRKTSPEELAEIKADYEWLKGMFVNF